MTPSEELLHLRDGAAGAQPPGEIDTLTAPGGRRTLERACEVLEPVLRRAASGGEWPGTTEWAELLPSWFTAACVDDAEVRDCVLDKWSLRAWTYWFHPSCASGAGGTPGRRTTALSYLCSSCSGRICGVRSSGC